MCSLGKSVPLLGLLCLVAACSDDTQSAPDAGVHDVAYDPDAGPPCPRRSTASYVRNLNSATGDPIYWSAETVSACIAIAHDPAGTEDIAGDEEREALWRALARWQDAARGCDAPLCFSDAGDVSRSEGIGYDRDGANYNLVTYVTDRETWSQGGRTSGIIATTILTSFVSSGVTVDADIEMNNVDFHYSAPEQPHTTDGTLDVESVLVHELGHLLGLMHTTDGASVMYPTESVGELKRDLRAPDIAGVCDIFACY